ncbi:predicted protein [Naegleria gruberi]|uniref:Predicted protein n=1 Tax=Naegleria gruberi TaxID=5762 RepID=D2VNB3_NAEGR|nr:uncharacterized protein NAEGRDRAFT_70435 [Naegleria gruberi]EFC41623.1 predicted protein [Naegleria gruberi]|eukprot:XP_002674367.1 predicted protein [Naegleria gruberi strain NEG-M]
MRVLNTSLYRTVSHQLSFSQLMKSWMQSKFKNSSLKNLKEFMKGYHENISRQYQDQKLKKKEHLQFLSQTDFSPFTFDMNSGGIMNIVGNIAGFFGAAKQSTDRILKIIDPSDSLYFGNDGVMSPMIDQIPDSSHAAFQNPDYLKGDASIRELLQSRGFKSLVKLFGKETLQSGSLIFLVYWFGKHNIKKRVFATILLFLFNVYMLVFDTNTTRDRFGSIIHWNIIFNLLSLTLFLLFKQHLNVTTGYSEQRFLDD